MKKALLLLAICLMVVPAFAQDIMLDHGQFRDAVAFGPADAYLADGVTIARSLPDTVEIEADLSNLAAACRKYGIPYTLQSFDGGYTPTADDCSAQVYFLNSYNLTTLYVLVDVVDDAIDTSMEPWQDDNVELFVDFDNSKQVGAGGYPCNDYDSNDAQFRVNPSDPEGEPAAVPVAVANPTSDANNRAQQGPITTRVEPFSGGAYSCLYALPMTSFGNEILPDWGLGVYPIPNGIMGINVQVHDADAGAEEGSLHLVSGHSYDSPATWGEVFLYTYTDITEAATAPTIDADGAEWADITTHGLFFEIHSETTDSEVMWQGMWDDDAIYFLTTVINDDVLAEGSADWQSDNVEVMFDFDNSKVVGGYGSDPTSDQQREVNGTTGQSGGGTRTTAQADTATGWVVEWAIAWDDWGGFPTSEFIGLDIHSADCDVADAAREGVNSWYEPRNDNAYQDESVFGTIRLVSGAAGVSDWTILDR
jgi:hypothetical protein